MSTLSALTMTAERLRAQGARRAAWKGRLIPKHALSLLLSCIVVKAGIAVDNDASLDLLCCSSSTAIHSVVLTRRLRDCSHPSLDRPANYNALELMGTLKVSACTIGCKVSALLPVVSCAIHSSFVKGRTEVAGMRSSAVRAGRLYSQTREAQVLTLATRHPAMRCVRQDCHSAGCQFAKMRLRVSQLPKNLTEAQHVCTVLQASCSRQPKSDL